MVPAGEETASIPTWIMWAKSDCCFTATFQILGKFFSWPILGRNQMLKHSEVSLGGLTVQSSPASLKVLHFFSVSANAISSSPTATHPARFYSKVLVCRGFRSQSPCSKARWHGRGTSQRRKSLRQVEATKQRIVSIKWKQCQQPSFWSFYSIQATLPKGR